MFSSDYVPVDVFQALALRQRRSPSVMLHCVSRDPLAFSQRACMQSNVAAILGPAWDLVGFACLHAFVCTLALLHGLLSCMACLPAWLAHLHGLLICMACLLACFASWKTPTTLHCNKRG